MASEFRCKSCKIIVNKDGKRVAMIRYTIPNEVKALFDTAFAAVNKSAVISELMRQAAEHELSLKRRRDAVDALMTERENARKVSNVSVETARAELQR